MKEKEEINDARELEWRKRKEHNYSFELIGVGSVARNIISSSMDLFVTLW